MRIATLLVCFALSPCLASASILVAQNPVSGGGVSRTSQLWQDPSPAGNDLDGDSVCWADFTLAQPASINHVEWWGNGASELGFKLEFWRQDPGTIAYQPLGVFYYGGSVPPVSPEPPGFIVSNNIATSPGPGGLTHYALDLATPVSLAANDSANPRWFVGVVGLTSQAYATWNWAQSLEGSHRTFQFIRTEGPSFRSLGDGRALILSDSTTPEPVPGDTNGDRIVDLEDLNNVRNHFGESGAGVVGDTLPFDGMVDLEDLNAVRNHFGDVAPSTVPEPNAITLFAMTAVALFCFRSRFHNSESLNHVSAIV